MMVIMEIKKNTQNNTSFHISSFLKKKENRIEERNKSDDREKSSIEKNKK